MGRSKDLATRVGIDDNADATAITINNAENVGIGTTSPSSKLTLKAANNGYTGGLRIEGVDETTALAITHVNGDNYFSGNATNDHLILNSSGYVTKPSQPSFAVTKNNGHVSAGNVYIFNSTEYSVGSMYNTSNGRGTAPVAGRYFVSTWLMSEANATYNNKFYQIRKNGGVFKSVYSANGGNNHHQWSWAGLMNLSANDYIDVYAYNMTLYGTSAYYSSFCMHLLS